MTGERSRLQFPLTFSATGRCHLETTPASVEGRAAHCRHEVVPGPYVQTESELRAAINRLMEDVLASVLA